MTRELEYFLEVWELDNATAEWLAHFPADVQTAITEQFTGEVSLSSRPTSNIVAEETKEIFVTQLPLEITEEYIWWLCGQCGVVTNAKIVRKENQTECAAVVAFASELQAEIAVHDLINLRPPGLHRPIKVRFALNHK